MRSTRSWFHLSGVAWAGAVALLTVAGLLGFQALEAFRAATEMEARAALAHREAVHHLQRYIFLGDPVDLATFHSALAFPRAVRVPLGHAAEFPGDHRGIRALVEADPVLLSGFQDFLPLWRLTGRRPEMRSILRDWEAADASLQELETLAGEIEAAARQLGPDGLPAALFADRLHQHAHQVDEARRAFGESLAAWTRRLERGLQAGFLFGGVFLAIMGGGVVAAASRSTGRMERELRESESRFRQMAESIDQVFWLTDPLKQKMLYVSPGFEAVWGTSVSTLYRSPKAWIDAVHPDDQMVVERAIPLQHRGAYDVQYRILRPDGEVRWIRDRAFPVQDEAGRVIRLAGVAEDVTHRRALEQEVVQGRTLRGVGRLAGNVAHEFNNLLTAVQGHLGLALDDLDRSGSGSPEELGLLRKDLEAAMAAVSQGGQLTRRLMAVGGRANLHVRPVCLRSSLQEWDGFLRAVLTQGIGLEMDVPAELPPARVDPVYLREALGNLLENCRNAMPDGGIVRIVARAEGGGQEGAGRIALAVEDDGPGIPSDKLDTLFDPFASEPEAGARLALGLPAVHRMVTDMDGEVKVETGAKGTRITLLLPVAPLAA